MYTYFLFDEKIGTIMGLVSDYRIEDSGSVQFRRACFDEAHFGTVSLF